MPHQYVATDKRTGFEVSVTGEFPDHPDDRMRIARTTTLFTRLMSTLLEKEETQRRLGFRAIETQLELADALIRRDHAEVQRLVRETLTSMGVDENQLRELAERLRDAGGLDPAVAQELARAFGLDPLDEATPAGAPIEADDTLEDMLDPKVLDAIREVLDASEDESDKLNSDEPDELNSDEPDGSFDLAFSEENEPDGPDQPNKSDDGEDDAQPAR